MMTFIVGFLAGWLMRGIFQAAFYRLLIKILAHNKGKEVILTALAEIAEKESHK